MKPDIDFVSEFELPAILLDSQFHITEFNDHFQAIFGDITGTPVTALSPDFNERRSKRRLESGQNYRFQIQSPQDQKHAFIVEVKACDGYLLGLLADASELVRNEALMESYSRLIEKQNKEIKEKTEQLNIWSKRIKDELEQARTVQALLVPDTIATDGLISYCLPLRELSGDFHEVARHDDGTLTFISGDVAGKGIYAAIILAQTLTAFRSFHTLPTLSQLAVKIVDVLEDRFPDGLFAALTLVRQSPDKQTIDLLNLGNPNALLVQDGKIIADFAADGPAIGVLPAIFYEDISARQIKMDDAHLYVFSDGIIDINLGRGPETFHDADEAHNYLCALDHKFGTNSLQQLIFDVQQHEQIDDVTIACFAKSEQSAR
ncbi:MAG: SpoIIE family protein phosphatase [Candidatus Puniceispirillaceae bacterium]